ncbi:hypothetical protein PR202_gb13502 [Eleusine coracana subsp. coracana]|uniref:EF-hand domain-containing protein n=1 Tax=Eleusine coracana subsp. coracana TaxID=191504 RepID=A0AAV5ET15_ELECO|nr:hypothetical protein QOZ80_9BG0715950 [Eleusine coracana subsp. coracana]GJN25647.1 hypothetical protein PR202_gb13502 [Eleusine coracana subsp. coracana]
MDKSPCGLQEPFCFEQVLHEPCDLLLILTILTWCVSRIQSLHLSLCQSCSHNPSNKATVAPVLTDKQVIKTTNKRQNEATVVTYEDIQFVMRSIGLNFDHKPSIVCSDIGDYIPQLFNDDEPSLHEVRQAFLVFDVNKDGYFDASDLLQVFKSLGLEEGVGKGECEQMIAKYDMNKDRRIDLVEFTKVLEASIF